MSKRPLPQSLEAERFVLGSLLSGDLEWPRLAELLTVDDLALEAHRRIYANAGELYKRGDPLNRVTLYAEFRAHGQEESVGGLSYLIDLAGESVPVNLESYIRAIKAASLRRRGIQACHAMQEELYADIGQPIETLERAAGLLRSLSAGESTKRGLRSPGEIIEQAAGGLDAIMNPHRHRRGIASPWPVLNYTVSSFAPPDLVVIAARPGYGKSAAAGQLAVHAAERGLGAALFSLEMSGEMILQRLACARAGVDSHQFRQGRISDAERRKLQAAFSDLADLPLRIDDSTGHSIPAIDAAVRKFQDQRGVGLVVVDYLQLLSGVGRKENRTQEVSEISWGLKRLAVEREVPVVALSQLNRASEHEKRRPVLSDLRESGSIEQDADVVIFIHWPDAAKCQSAPGEVEFIVAKQRCGPVGKVQLFFNPSLCRFEDRTAPEETCQTNFYATD